MNERFSIPNPHEQERGQAEQHIRAIRQQIEAMGANDYEPGAIERVIASLREGTLSPQEAVAAAEAIRDGKQDYH